ncbi:transcriptional repressor [Azoarcus indigens]|uniref:Fur family zinc uptake transcriptional regulator n=1 Tax=Azoarcus indigens TaxID=29545 RepID=A0A4R6E229_9RHOO|nr:Fur family transcriptional regulator [Azoarcus indigens]NMG66211.1 transcriptional repressor [Azoarcus indigens]TDN51324.1 Fur family zinc uptake transcriptional regulator [Azoarcus indigens]
MNLTDKQRQVLSLLEGGSSPLSAYELLDRLRGSGFSAPTQVYRVLEKLTANGLVHRVASLNAYVRCAHPEELGHGLTAFAICDDCGQIDEFVDPELVHGLSHWAGQAAFAMREASIEVRGRCANCSAHAA